MEIFERMIFNSLFSILLADSILPILVLFLNPASTLA